MPISQAAAAFMDGLSIELTSSYAAYVSIGMGSGTNANLLGTSLRSGYYLNLGWGTCANCSVVLTDPNVGTSLSLSGTALTSSNVTILRGAVGAGAPSEVHRIPAAEGSG